MLNTRWIPLFATTFLGVFNANYLKLLIITIGVNWMNKGEGANSLIVSVTSSLFFISYIFFSPLAGKLAKTKYKKNIIIYARVFQFPVYLLACVGFYVQNIFVVFACIFLIGFSMTLYGPAKHSLIRDIGGVKGISFGTGTLEMLTFLGNLIGPLVAALIADNYNFWLLSGILIGVAVLNYFVILSLKVKESDPLTDVTEPINPVSFFLNSYKWAKTFGKMNLIVLGLGFFWMIDAVLQMNLFVHCPEVLKMSNTGMSIIMTVALVGIGLGCYAAGVISSGKVKLLLTPIGGLGMAISLLLMVLIQPKDVYLFSVLIFLIAMFSGIFMVPLSAYIQTMVEGRKQSDMIAYSNFITFVLLFTGSGIFGIIAKLLGTNAVFLFLLLTVILITTLLVSFVPEMKDRFKGLLLFIRKN